MSTATLTSTDVQLRDAVVHQLDWDPEVDGSAIGVTAKEGVVTLTGYVDTYMAKINAERVTKRVRGVRAVANDIMVRLRLSRTDSELARDASEVLRLRPDLPQNIQVAVHSGHVTLTGTAGWLFQKQQAEQAVRHVAGVVGVFNHIDVKQVTSVRDMQRRIVRALHNSADLDARHIKVGISGDTVVLSGTVTSWAQREVAEHAAGAAPGIALIDNQILVVPAEGRDVEPPDDMC